MTEKPWGGRRRPPTMLKFALRRATQRKPRLLSAVLWECRSAWLADSTRLRVACERAVRFADMPQTAANRKKMSQRFIVSNTDAHEAATETVTILAQRDLRFPDAALTWYLHEIFGPTGRPFRPQKAWLTSTVVALAQGIYDDSAFDRLPILADALMDAGCDDERVLSHCRVETAWAMPPDETTYSRPAPTHVRGCWVIDMLLGKS